MKKIVGLLIAVLCGTTLINAQDNGDFRFGFKFEPNVSWLNPKDKNLESTGSSLRFSYGLNADIMFAENYAFGTGLTVTSNGGEVTYLSEYNSDSGNYIVEKIRDYNNKYVEIPLTLKLRTNEIGYMTYWFQFGLGLGVNIDARANEEIEFKYQQIQGSTPDELIWSKEVSLPAKVTNDKEPIGNDVRTFRTALIIGAGVEYSLSGSTAIIGGITFNNGFSNVLKKDGIRKTDTGEPIFEDGEPKSFDLKAISNHLGLTIGILF